MQTITYDEALRDKVVVDTPRQVIGRLRELRDELGLDGILAEINCGSLIPHDKVMHAPRLLCQEVMPAFQQRERRVVRGFACGRPFGEIRSPRSQ